MKSRSLTWSGTLGLVLTLALSLLATVALAKYPPTEPPHRFYGTVTSEGTAIPAADGLVVTAVVDGVEKGSSLTVGGWYGTEEGGTLQFYAEPGATVDFYFQGVDTGQSYTGWTSGGFTRHDLTVVFTETAAPPVPVLLTPADGSFTNDNTPIFDWTDVSYPTSVVYDLQLDDGADFVEPVIDEPGLFDSEYTTVAMSDGTYYWRVRAVDTALNSSAWTDAWSVHIDTLAPTVDITALATDPTFDSTPTFTGIADDGASPIGSVEYRLDHGAWSAARASDGAFDGPVEGYTFTTSALSDGPHIVEVRATDAAGNTTASEGYAADTFEVDTGAPWVAFTAVPASLTNDSTPSFKGTATDIAGTRIAWVEYRVDGVAWIAATPLDGSFDSFSEGYTFTTSALADGEHTVEVGAQDDLGNWTDAANYATYSFTVDTTPPEVAIDDLPYHPATPLATPTFTGTATDATSAIDCVEYCVFASDGTTLEIDWTATVFTPDVLDSRTGTYTLTTLALAEDGHFLEVRAADAAGNSASTGYSLPDGFRVVAKPLARFDPDTPMTASEPMWVTAGMCTRDSTPTFHGDAMSGLTAITAVQCNIDGGAWAGATFMPALGDPRTGTWEFTPAPLSDGPHFIQAKAIDEAGEETPLEVCAEGGTGYLAFATDTTPPTISDIEVSDITPNSAVVTWRTNEPSTSRVEYGQDARYGSVNEDIGLATEHHVALEGLQPGTSYHFRVRSMDDAGNEGVSEDNIVSMYGQGWPYTLALAVGVVVLAVVLFPVVRAVRRRRAKRSGVQRSSPG